MTGEAVGPLGRRFLAAFAAVSLLTVVLVAAAGLVGSDRGLESQDRAQRQAVAQRAAAAVADAYRDAGGWPGAELDEAASVARGGGGLLVVRDAAGRVLWSDRMAGHRGMPGMRMLGDPIAAPVEVGGARVGEAVVRFGGMTTRAGRPVAWAWIGVAAVAALLAALVASWFVTRQLTRPVASLTSAARAFATGDRDATVADRGVGELGELADAFDEAMAAVRRAEGARSQMAADVAHELRTPLAALQAGLEELRDGLAPADAATLARLHDQALRLGRIVGDLDVLFAAEGAARQVRRDPVDLGRLAREGVEARAAQLRAAGLVADADVPDEPVVVTGDPERLHQVLGNLLENCVRHCRPGDRVTVRVAGGPNGPELTVADSGPGIEPADLPHVFERFWRGPHQEGEPGSGLGLAVVRSLVRGQGGEVVVESDGATGTTVTVALPLRQEVTGAASVAPGP
jgi:two-component system sensor histidine kinase BaeS